MVDINDNISQHSLPMDKPFTKDDNENEGYENIEQQSVSSGDNNVEAEYENMQNDKGYENLQAPPAETEANYEAVEDLRSHRSSRAASPTGSTRSNTSSMPRPDSPDEYPLMPPSDCLLLPDKKYNCVKCEKILCHPVQLQECGHRLCYKCFKEIVSISDDNEPARCPADLKEIESKIPSLDKAFWDEIQSLDVKCKNHEWGCKWEGTAIKFEDHDNTCDYSDVLCTFDCGTKFQRRFYQKHLDKDCPKQVISCPYCDARHLREEKKNHLEECSDIPLPCPNKCDKKLMIKRAKLEDHVDNECPRTKILCEFENIGCAHRSSREKMAKHYTKETSSHIKLLYGMLLKQEQTLETHNERLRSSENSMMEQDKRIGDLEKIAHSQLIWRIEDYGRKLKESKAGNMESLFSPTFTTSKHGYRLCASVCLNGDGKGKGTHMSVFISILKGHFDPLLKWPFDYRVTFLLLDQNEDISARKHIKFSIKPNPCAENEPFLGRPKMEKNASFGGAKFARHEEIESGAYIKDEVAFLKIIVDCDGLSEP